MGSNGKNRGKCRREATAPGNGEKRPRSPGVVGHGKSVDFAQRKTEIHSRGF